MRGRFWSLLFAPGAVLLLTPWRAANSAASNTTAAPPLCVTGRHLSADPLIPCEAKPSEYQHLAAADPALSPRLSVSFDTVLSRVCFCVSTFLYKSLET